MYYCVCYGVISLMEYSIGLYLGLVGDYMYVVKMTHLKKSRDINEIALSP